MQNKSQGAQKMPVSKGEFCQLGKLEIFIHKIWHILVTFITEKSYHIYQINTGGMVVQFLTKG